LISFAVDVRNSSWRIVRVEAAVVSIAFSIADGGIAIEQAQEIPAARAPPRAKVLARSQAPTEQLR
jgi:hypothetical protein